MQHSMFRGLAYSANALCRLRAPTAFAGTMIGAALGGSVLVVTGPAPLAKSPGASWCYRDVCHRVRTIEQTSRLVGQTQIIETSFYDDPRNDRMNRGKYTSNGEEFDAGNPSRVSSSDFPDGTELLLRNPENGETSHVRVNDFGPFYANRTLDVTKRVAIDLGFQKKGVARLEVTVIAAPAEEESGYRRNRVLPSARGHVGVLDADQFAILGRQLIGDNSTTRLADGRPPASTVVPDVSTASSGTLTIAVVEEQQAQVPAKSAEPPIEVVGAIVTVAAAEPAEAAPFVVAAISAIAESSPTAVALPATSVIAAVTQVQAPQTDVGSNVQRVDEIPVPARPIIVAQAPVAVAEPSPSGESVRAMSFVQIAPQGSTGPGNSTWSSSWDVSWPTISGAVSSALARPGQSTSLVSTNGTPSSLMLTLIAGIGSLLMYSAWLFAGRPRAGAIAAAGVKVQMPVASGRETKLAPLVIRVEPSAEAPVLSASVESSPAPVAMSLPSVAVGTGLRNGSYIGPGIVIEGTMTSTGRVEIAGQVIGTVNADSIDIAPGGGIEGKVNAKQVSIGGRFKGSIKAVSVTVGADAELNGEVVSTSIAAHPTARMDADFRRPKV